jgi:hypothetical protein
MALTARPPRSHNPGTVGRHDGRSEEEAMTDGLGQVLDPIAREVARPQVALRPAISTARAQAPDALQCLRCQLLGRRRLTCSRAELCREAPRFHPVGAILLAAWLATAAAFVAAAW